MIAKKLVIIGDSNARTGSRIYDSIVGEEIANSNRKKEREIERALLTKLTKSDERIV